MFNPFFTTKLAGEGIGPGALYQHSAPCAPVPRRAGFGGKADMRFTPTR